MREILIQVERWRAKSDELRSTADTLTNAVARDSLLEMADGYDRLADSLEDLAAKKLADVLTR